MLDSFANYFISFNVEKISAGLNKKQLYFFCFVFFNIHLRKKIGNFSPSFLNYYTTKKKEAQLFIDFILT